MCKFFFDKHLRKAQYSQYLDKVRQVYLYITKLYPKQLKMLTKVEKKIIIKRHTQRNKNKKITPHKKMNNMLKPQHKNSRK